MFFEDSHNESDMSLNFSHIWFAALVLMIGGSAPAGGAGRASLLLRLSFDSDPSAPIQPGFATVPGKKGRALSLRRNDSIRLMPEMALNPQSGTAEFWVHPEVSWPDRQKARVARLLYFADPARKLQLNIYYHAQASGWDPRLMASLQVGEDYAEIGASRFTLPRNAWTHLAVTWKRNLQTGKIELDLYRQGSRWEKVFHGDKTRTFPDAKAGLVLGGGGQMAIDEVCFYDRAIYEGPVSPVAEKVSAVRYGGKIFPFEPFNRAEDGAKRWADADKPATFYGLCEPGLIGAERIPPATEWTDTLDINLLQGQPVDRFVGLYLHEALENPSLALLPAPGQDVLPAGIDLEVLRVRYWPQRPSWHACSAVLLPEIVESLPAEITAGGRHFSFPATRYDTTRLRWVRDGKSCLPARRNAPLLLRASASPDAPPGVHHCRLRLASKASPEVATLDLALRVLPATPLEPTEPLRMMFVFGGISPAEAAALHDHAGIDSILLRRWAGVKIESSDEGLQIHSAGFDDYAQMARIMRNSGMTGPLVVDWPGLETIIGRQLGIEGDGLECLQDKRVARIFVAVLRRTRLAVEKAGIERVWFFPFDEPGTNSRRQKLVLRQSELAHRAGLKTFLTSYHTEFNQGPGQELFDVVIQSAGSPEEAIERRKEANARNGKWMFLAGAYSDGWAAANRRTGLELFRTGADGVAFWIWRSIKGNIWNDFDGADRHEAKDAVIAYPPLHQVGWDGPYTETLQSVGIRQARQDVRLYQALEARVTTLPADAPSRQQIKTFLQKLRSDFDLGEDPAELKALAEEACILLQAITN